MSSPNVCYTPGFYTAEESQQIFQQLLEYPFKSNSLTVYGKKYIPLRKTCSFADNEDVTYTYSGHVDIPKLWTPLLMEIKSKVEKQTGFAFNYCLINLYENGKAKIGAHKDNENCLTKDVPISTVSFGSTRTMTFLKKGEKSVIIPLEAGSLLMMNDQEWLHAIYPENVPDSRISLTFRKIDTFTTTILHPMKRELDNWDQEYLIKTSQATKHVRVIAPPPSPSSSTSSADKFLEIVEHSTPPTTSMDIPNHDWLTEFIQEENKTLQKFNLGDDLYVSVQIFKGKLCVHIRQHFRSMHHAEAQPSRLGVKMDMETFFKFRSKIFSMTLTDRDESTVFNNTIIGFVENRQLRLTRFTALGFFQNSVTISQDQFEILKNCIGDMEVRILDYLFRERLPRLICEDVSYVAETMDFAFTQLKTLVEDEILQHVNNHFKCAACQIDSCAQYRHDCINFSSQDKFRAVGDSIRMLCDVDVIAELFLKDNNLRLSKDLDFLSLSYPFLNK